ncbi:tetratricopeptide repeat protein [Luteolibacter algae]|uniref:Tetratricopeptide repeat protein n=1 Tax=Luteolibacter algae TaxID=454151 RepID=A0ABW5D6C6_9BACT
MKTLVVFLTLAAGSSLALAQSAGQKAEAYYQRGLAAEKAGDPATASAAYNAALKLFPNHANARYRAGQVKINASAIKSSATQAKIGAVMISVYQLEDATVQEAIDALSAAMSKQNDGEISPNFVIEDPQNKLADRRVTINLRNVPVKAILDYLHSQTNTKARYDEHAVVILAR